MRWILHAWLRPGDVSSSNNVIHFLSECLALARNLVDITLVRADSGFFDGAFLRYLEDEVRLPYLVKARFTHVVKRSIYESNFWTPIYRGTDVSEAIVQLQGWDRPRRLVLIRHAVKENDAKKPGQKLFEWQGYRFQAIVTSFAMHEMSAVAVYRTYNQRGEFENRIKELKAGCGLNGFCLDSL